MILPNRQAGNAQQMFGWTVDLTGVPQAIDKARYASGPARIIVVPR